MKAISYIYAVLNDYISCDDFVNWTFEAIEEGQMLLATQNPKNAKMRNNSELA